MVVTLAVAGMARLFSQKKRKNKKINNNNCNYSTYQLNKILSGDVHLQKNSPAKYLSVTLSY